jgi:acetyltransferase-like isoleucine patch superfamily enzyme
MDVTLTAELLKQLRDRGVECFLGANAATLPLKSIFEPPCSLKWMGVYHSLEMGRYSYAVSGYFMATRMGRYCSIGEQVQIGRGDHPTSWLSTNPAFYLQDPLFSVGHEFPGSVEYHGYKPETSGWAPLPPLKPVIIGNDVWIGHGALFDPASRSATAPSLEPMRL